MNGHYLLAFVIAPIVVVALGWAAVLLNERIGRDGGHPAE